MALRWWNSIDRSEQEDRTGREEAPPPGRAEPARCPTCGREVFYQSQQIRGASTAINILAHCEVHGVIVEPVEPETVDTGRSVWGEGYASAGRWRSPAPEQESRRRRPPPMSERYAVGAVRAPKPAPKPKFDPLPPLDYGNG
jgi:hypothetical protein